MTFSQSGLAPSTRYTKRGAHTWLKRRDLEGTRHPTRGMRDLRIAGNASKDHKIKELPRSSATTDGDV